MVDSVLAARIAAAFDTAGVVEPRLDEIPQTMDAAERMEDGVAAMLGPIGGFKLGATIAQVRAALGVPRPFFGPLPQDRVRGDGAELRGDRIRQRGVESEYAFRFGRDLTHTDAEIDVAGLADAIASVHAAIEIPATRFARLGGHGGLALVADIGAAGFLVVGPGEPLGDPERLNKAPVILEIEGADPVHGSGAVIEGGRSVRCSLSSAARWRGAMLCGPAKSSPQAVAPATSRPRPDGG